MFKRGNVVELDNYEGLVVLEYTYGERYGNGEPNGEWSVLFLKDGNSLAWENENKMKLVDEGGERIIQEAKKNRDQFVKKNEDLNYIKKVFKEKGSKGISSTSILYLFNKVTFDTSFNRNGEFFILNRDWNSLLPIYEALFKGEKEEMNKYIDFIFLEKYKQGYKDNFNNFYNDVNNL